MSEKWNEIICMFVNHDGRMPDLCAGEQVWGNNINIALFTNHIHCIFLLSSLCCLPLFSNCVLLL